MNKRPPLPGPSNGSAPTEAQVWPDTRCQGPETNASNATKETGFSLYMALP